jgi:hypothetical protein
LRLVIVRSPDWHPCGSAQRIGGFFEGSLTRVRMWNRVLNAGEILARYSTDFAPGDGLAAEFLLDNDTGARAMDTAQDNNRTL